MHGDYRIPTIIKAIDSKTREFSEKIEEEEMKPIEIDFGSFDEWVKETEENGFKYNR